MNLFKKIFYFWTSKGYVVEPKPRIKGVKKGTLAYYHELRHQQQNSELITINSEKWFLLGFWIFYALGWSNITFWKLLFLPFLIWAIPELYFELDAQLYAFKKVLKRNMTRC